MQNDILIGTLVHGNEHSESYIRQIIPHGFESFAITFGNTFKVDPEQLAEKIMPMLRTSIRMVRYRDCIPLQM